MRDEKMHAVVARSTFPSQNVQSTPGSDHFWKLRCRKSARRCGTKHISSQNVQNTPCSDHSWKLRCRKSSCGCDAKHVLKSKCKSTRDRTTFGRSDVEKCHAVVARSTFPSRNVQSTPGSDHFWTFKRSFRVAGAGIVHLVKKVSKTWGFWRISKNHGRRGTLQRICNDAFSVAGAVQETCSSEMLGGPGANFLRTVAFCSIRSSVLGKWFRVTGAALRMTWPHFFVAGAALYTDGVENSQNALARGRQLCTQLSIFEGSLAELLPFLMLSAPKNEEVLQNCFVLTLSSSNFEDVWQSCFVFDVVNFKHWGSLAELLRFWCCQVSNPEDVSQNSFVFKLADRQVDR